MATVFHCCSKVLIGPISDELSRHGNRGGIVILCLTVNVLTFKCVVDCNHYWHDCRLEDSEILEIIQVSHLMDLSNYPTWT